MTISKKQLYLIGFITLFGLGSVGVFLIEFFQDRSFATIFQHGWEWELQLLCGLGYGLFSAWAAWQIVRSDILKPVRNYFVELFQQMNLRLADVIFLSLCAGVGEEILFRGAIQAWLGIWLTSILFIVLHGYLNPTNWRISIYGFYMIFLSAGLGYLYQYIGMLSAMTAHFTIDLVLLALIMRYRIEE